MAYSRVTRVWGPEMGAEVETKNTERKQRLVYAECEACILAPNRIS